MGGGGGNSGGISPSSPPALAEPLYSAAKISVWWDIENCHVPKDFEAHAIAQNISSALVNLNYCGPVSISAYGDTNGITQSVQQALNSTGIALNHVPSGVKDASDKKILVDMLFWAVDNPAPANYLLISGDRDFSNALHQLRMRRYNILLAQPKQASASLVAAAKSVWLWKNLVAGGPPLTKGESPPRIDNAGSDRIGSPDTESNKSNQPEVKPFNMGKGTDCKPKKQLRKKLSQPNISRTSSPPIGTKEDYNSVNYHQSGYSYTNQFKDPQGLSGDYNHTVSLGRPAPNFFPSNSESSWTTNNNLQSSYQNHHPQPVMPNNQPCNYFVPDPHARPPRMMFNRPDGPFNPRPRADGPGFDPRSRPNGPSFDPRPRQDGPGFDPRSRPDGSGFEPWPIRDGPAFNPPLVQNVPDFERLKLSEYPHRDYNPPTSQPRNTWEPQHSTITSKSQNHLDLSGQQRGPMPNKPPFTHDHPNNLYPPVRPDFQPPPYSEAGPNNISVSGVWGTPGCPKPSEYVQGLIGVILLALNTLKSERIVPSEVNIADCIRYGDPRHRNTDVKKALDSALEQQLVTKLVTKSKGGALQVFVGKNDKLWGCANPVAATPKDYPKAAWDELKKFLSSSAGRIALLASQCRYEAATIVKNMCLKDVALGDILSLLHMAISSKKWMIVPHHSGWQPIKIILAETNPTNLTNPANPVNPTNPTNPANPINPTDPSWDWS